MNILQRTILIGFTLFFLLFSKSIMQNRGLTSNHITQEKINSLDQIIEENKGKVIYIDFWASWCKPCREELPKSLKLHKKYKDKVVFVYLSIDLEEEVWKKASIKESIADQKYNLITIGFKKSLALKGMKLQSIPRYMIFDKEGKLVNNDAPRPSDKNLIDEFNKYL